MAIEKHKIMPITQKLAQTMTNAIFKDTDEAYHNLETLKDAWRKDRRKKARGIIKKLEDMVKSDEDSAILEKVVGYIGTETIERDIPYPKEIQDAEKTYLDLRREAQKKYDELYVKLEYSNDIAEMKAILTENGINI